MAMIQLPQDFKDFLKLVKSHEVRYLLIGGYAVIYHGFPRATGDMDVWVAVSPDNASKLVDVLKDFGFEVPDISPNLVLEEGKVIRMGLPPIRLKILTSVSGVSFEECFNSRIVERIDDVEINIISLEFLKKNKKASGRYKDLNDLENLP